MREVKHCCSTKVKHYLIPPMVSGADNQPVLDANELRRRLVDAMDRASPRVTSARLASVCGVTAQAVNGWRKTGRLAKRHLSKIAVETGKPLNYFLDEEVGTIQASHGLTLKIEEAEAMKRLQSAMPEWRHYVLGLAMVDDKRTQQVLLDTMRQAVPDKRVEEFVPIAPHAAERKKVKGA